MRKMVNTIMTAVVLAALAVGAGTTNAATFTPGTLDTPSPPGHGFPRWYTEPSPPAASGQSLELCLSQTVSTNPDALGGLMCILLPEPAPPAPPTIFNPAAPIVFPTNFPSESFYFIADAILLNLTPGGSNRATYRAAIEAAFANGSVVSGEQITFARVRFRVDAPVNGTYRITHPFGQRTFQNITAGPAAIDIQEDIEAPLLPSPPGPLGNPIVTPVAPNGQAGGGLQRFLVRANAPGGAPNPIVIGNETFIGDPNVDQNVTGATQPDPNDPLLPFNSFMVEVEVTPGAGFVVLEKTDNFALAGKMIGLAIAPPAEGTNYGTWKLNLVNPLNSRTFTVTNVSGLPVTLDPVTSSNPEFTIPLATDNCSNVQVPAQGTCTFAVVFAPTVNGSRSATLTVSSPDTPTATTTVTGTGDGIAPTLAINAVISPTNLTTQTITGTVSDNIANGLASVTVAVGAGTPINAVVTGTTWTADVTGLAAGPNTITVVATDNAQPAPGNQTTQSTSITVDTTAPVLTIDPVTTPTRINSQAITGTVNDNVAVGSVTVSVNGGQAQAAIVTGTTWSFTASGLVEGANSIVVNAVDTAQPTPNAAAPQSTSITLDTQVSPFTLTPVTTPTKEASQTIGGTVEAGSSVQVSLNGGAAAAAIVTDTTWSFNVTGLTLGANNIVVTATDLLGNTATLPAVITFAIADGNMDLSTEPNPVTIADALMALRTAVNLFTPTDEQKAHGDVAPLDTVTGQPNPDGSITVADALLILRKVVGLISF